MGGNYLCQHLFIFSLDDSYCKKIVAKIAPDFVTIACDRQGTRALQKIMQHSGQSGDREEQQLLLNSMNQCKKPDGMKQDPPTTGNKANPILMQLMEDPNGCHVILSLLKHFPYEMVEFMFTLSFSEYKELAKNRHGLCVLKRCVSLCPPEMFMVFSEKVLK